MTPERLMLAAGSALGFVGVAAGAFGAHALKGRVEPALLEAFETGARYNLVHAAALVAAASAATGPLSRWAGLLFVGGTAVFSGSLYALALTGVRGWGALTPLGGTMLLGAWLCLALAALGR